MELEDTLKSWGCEGLIEVCREKRFTVEAILELTETTVGLITPYPGEQLVILKRIREYHSQPLPRTTPSCATPSTSAQSLGNKKRASSTTTSLQPAQKKIALLQDQKIIEELDLRQVLNEHSLAKYVVQYYEDTAARLNCSENNDDEEEDGELPSLSQTQRECIVSAVVEHLRVKLSKPSHHLFPLIGSKIIELFPTETLETYYIPPKTGSNLSDHPRGKLPDKFRNLQTKANNLKHAGLLSQQSSGVQTTKQFHGNLRTIIAGSITPEVQAAAAWLVKGRNWPKVLKSWEITAPLRYQNIFHSGDHFINNYLSKWPVLAHPSGYELLLLDFNIIYPKASSLFAQLGIFESRTISIARKDVKDKLLKACLKEYSPTLDQNARLSIILKILPGIRSNRRANSVKVSQEKSRNSYLLYLKTANNIKNAIRERRNELTSEDGGGQPLLVFVGPSDININVCYVSIAETLFQVDGVAEALDLFIKSFHALHIAYPPESSYIWTVIQRGIYKLETEWDKDIEQTWINIYK